MNLMDKPGNIRIAWGDNGAIDLEVKGDTFDVFCALAAAVSQCVKRNIREEGQVECLKKFNEMLLDLHKMPALVIDADAIMGGVRGMSKAFDPAELEEMRADLDRNPGYKGLGVVAQLHACKRGDVIDALGLDPEDYARKPQPKVTPEQRADAVARVLAGENTADIAIELGINKNTVYAWVSKAKQEAAVSPQPESAVKTPSPPRPEVKLSAVAQSHFEDLDAAIDYMRSVKLLDDEDMNVLGPYLAALNAFAQGLEYAEKYAERSAE